MGDIERGYTWIRFIWLILCSFNTPFYKYICDFLKKEVRNITSNSGLVGLWKIKQNGQCPPLFSPMCIHFKLLQCSSWEKHLGGPVSRIWHQKALPLWTWIIHTYWTRLQISSYTLQNVKKNINSNLLYIELCPLVLLIIPNSAVPNTKSFSARSALT